MHYAKHLMAIAASAVMAGQALAAPTAEEVKQLGTTLTPIGAEKVGNKDGTIPAWDGGLCTPPPGYKPRMGADAGGGPYVDPYANEKPLFRIAAANLSKYADKIDEGTKELFKRYPTTFAIDVYPTHRTACYPNWVYENTIKRVMNPKLVGAAPGLVGAHAQIPFPIPKTGYEVMWNVLTKFTESPHKAVIGAGLMDASGIMSMSSVQTIEEDVPYWDNSLTSIPEDKPFRQLVASTTFPASQVGSKSLRLQFLRADLVDDMAWAYAPGQRRVRRSPEFKYDTVSTTSGGVLLFDEISAFEGKMDKYDFKLIGKKEMYVPYNSVKILSAPMEDAMKKGHANQDLMRWELHRVWVVEGTLKAGERHVQQKKVFYVDEDSWATALYYSLDHAGKVHHMIHLQMVQEYDKPAPRFVGSVLYDVSRGIYNFGTKQFGLPEQYGYIKVKPYPANFFTPDAMGGRGVR